ncbi:lytic transglycosylase domain-containing protein [Streptomyces physcomitrii]|uniref:Lytic transglycosylase n=1 Tax=Streptomyces physcomitrii TaxID=2724184 RepID=A0ABX1H243_9ACTN|nr:lytic murein transglycosylase [Streptomyces physcomitrii]NKI41314.1 lytic transglycosylase [Streptomyces physcomitrii]
MSAFFGSRLRRGAGTAAVAAVVVAALSASQAPGLSSAPERDRHAGAEDTPPPGEDTSVSGNSPYYTDLPPLESPAPVPGAKDPEGSRPTESGIPATVLDAYKKAESALARSRPGCNLPWQLLAAIGKVESGQARGGRVDAAGTTLTPILGPVLDGNGFARITDTDGGLYDGDTVHDRAVGPMQFIPSTWENWGADANGDGRKDPNNIYDAALAAGSYLCAGGRDLADEKDLHAAILGYNRSEEYLRTVLSWLEFYRKGIHEIPDGTGGLPSTPPYTPKPKPGPAKPGGSTPNPGPAKPDKPGKPEEPGKPGDPEEPGEETPTPSENVFRLEDAGTGTLTSATGELFAEQVTVRAEGKNGKPIAKAKIRFEIVGETDSRFPDGQKRVTVPTGADGKALAPALRAGKKDGTFTVRATVEGRDLAPVDHTATVTAPPPPAADALVRTDDAPLTCAPNAAFAQRVKLKATLKGAAAPGVATTATLIKAENDPKENDKGPFFKDADGKPVRTLKNLKTDDKGLLTLDPLYSDQSTGDFLLRLTTEGGATLTVKLTVQAPAA